MLSSLPACRSPLSVKFFFKNELPSLTAFSTRFQKLLYPLRTKSLGVREEGAQQGRG